MVAEDKLKVHPAGFTDGGRIGLHDHTGRHGQHAGSLQGTSSAVHHADTAVGRLVDVLEEAESGDFHIGFMSRFKHRRTGRNFYLHAVDGDGNHLFHG